ncbi:hypothetical protein [Streptomyces sp. WAC01280]|uniref:hypothetical protein n=1 Tax=Streptomyces sp. WAC01280 TaxID=2487424 RepID=UPI000F790F50|nr:hypothetical protein [Streptomyces sp. WAC01280]RSS59847.1 hypothetical protein EF909_08285 [Streptomyces sp. WAC01280]
MTTNAKPEAPHHRNLNCYKHFNCRLPECVARYSAYRRRVHRQQGYGTWQPFVDAEPVRRHLQLLDEYGISFEQTARLAGLKATVVAGLLYPMGSRGIKQRLRAETADKILAVKPVPENLNELRPIDATGTRRRLQALVAIGFPFLRLGEHLPIHPNQVHYVASGRRVQVKTARAVAALYDQLWNQNPADYGIRPATSLKVKRYAASKGWAPPAAWDDDTIDDPTAQPDLGEHTPRFIALAENALELEKSQGYTRQQAADRLEVSKEALQQAIGRYRAMQQTAA